jgi:hypothetical protein
MNVKELIDKIPTTTAEFIGGYNGNKCLEFILKSDFDRVVEELTKPKTFNVDCARNVMIQIVATNNGISITKAMNGWGDSIPISEIIINEIPTEL